MERDENLVFEEWQKSAPEAKPALVVELDHLLRKHAYAVCWLLLKEQRKDIVNYAVYKALQNMDKFRGEAKFSTWFHHIVQNLCRDEGRERARRNEVGLDDLNQDELGQIANGDDARLELERITRDLEPEDRDFLAMKMAGKDETDIAAETGVSREVVRQRWFRLRKRILRRLQAT